MPEIRETTIPGVGSCLDFATRAGARVGVVKRSTGRRELVVYDRHDPDAVRFSVDLNAEEAGTLADFLGNQVLTERIGALAGLIEGLSVDWITLPGGFAPTTIADLEIRRRTGASVVAVVRDGAPVPAPGPDFRFEAGDVAVVVGTPEGVADASRLLDL